MGSIVGQIEKEGLVHFLGTFFDVITGPLGE
jgi:hypothetical protein